MYCTLVCSYVTDMIREMEAHCQLKHPNVLQLVGFIYEPEKELGLLMSYEDYGNAHSFIRRYEVPTSWKINMAYEVALGLNYLHTIKPNPVIHGDLKLVNVLVGKGYVAKVCCHSRIRLYTCQAGLYAFRVTSISVLIF